MSTTTHPINYPDVHSHFRVEFYEKAKKELGRRVGMETVFDLAAERFAQKHGFACPFGYWAFEKRLYK